MNARLARQALLLRYSRYQALDFIVQRLALPLVLIAFAAGLPTWVTIRHTPPGFMHSPQGALMARQLFTQSLTLFLPLGAFVAAVGVVSADRQQGHVRFLFSKPVNVVAYYAQLYLVEAAAYVLVYGLLVWGFGALTIHFSVHRAMEAAALTFVLVGGLGLLLGALTRFDAGLLIVLYLAALVLQQLAGAPNAPPDGGMPSWIADIGRALPPVVKLDHLREQLYAGHAVDVAALWHVLGYGGGAAVLGFVLLRRLPLSR